MDENEPDIVGIAETELKKDIKSHVVFLEGYTVRRKGREDTGGGGGG